MTNIASLVCSKDGILGYTNRVIINNTERYYIIPTNTIRQFFQEAIDLNKLKLFSACTAAELNYEIVKAPMFGV